MAERTEPPEDLRWIIVPDKQTAKLFARSLAAFDVGVLHPAESERLVEYASSGAALCLVQEDGLDSERVLDMRM